MLFNSLEYVVFLVVIWAAFYSIPHRWRWVLLLAASYAFYMTWNAAYIPLIVSSTLIDYTIGLALGRTEHPHARRGLVLASVGMNLGLLFYFKYWNFFNDSAAHVAGSLGVNWWIPSVDVLLPVGISFYTFQTLSYTIDVYRRVLKPEPNLGRFTLYVAFFPQLVAGPIERATRLLPQLEKHATFDSQRAVSSVTLILWGLFKKVAIADHLAVYVDAVYREPDVHNAATWSLVGVAFFFQLYCDFSGYTDIAIGSARLLGIELSMNFRTPYLSRSVREFWTRWHISLSLWVRDYVFRPLATNRRSKIRTNLTLILVMILLGLWHGARWNFVLFGVLHGTVIVLSNVTKKQRCQFYKRLSVPSPVLKPFEICCTMVFICYSALIFRAGTLADLAIIHRAFMLHWGEPWVAKHSLALALLGLSAMLVVEILASKPKLRASLAAPTTTWIPSGWMRAATLYVLIFAILLLGVEQGNAYIYFQF